VHPERIMLAWKLDGDKYGNLVKGRKYADMSFGRLAFVLLLPYCFAQAEPYTRQLQLEFERGEKLSQADSDALVEYDLEEVHPFALEEYMPNEALPARAFGITLNRKSFGEKLPVLELRLPEDYYFLGLQLNTTALSRNAPSKIQKFDPAPFKKRERIFLVQLKEEDFVEDKNNDESLLHIEIAGKDTKNRFEPDYSCYLRAFIRDQDKVEKSKIAKRE
jgi:hypothetical protein